MTSPMLFGLCMTIHYILVFKLRPMFLRRWTGLILTGIGVAAYCRVFDIGDARLIAVLASVSSGLTLLFGRDPFYSQGGER